MKVFARYLLAAGILVSYGMAANAKPTTQDKPGVVDAITATVTATVEKIDYKNRMVTLKGPDGTLEEMQIGPEATRFNEVKKGDEVTIDYLESVAIVVQSPHETVSSAEGTKSVIIRNKGKKPSGTMMETNVTTATVEKINAKKRTATLRGADGNSIHVDIAPDVTNLENVKKGDQVIVKHTRTVAIDVRKPTK